MTGKDIADKATVALNALAVIETITGIHNATADAVLAGIRSALAVVHESSTGSIAPAEALGRLEKLHATVAAHDAAADTKLREKFPTG